MHQQRSEANNIIQNLNNYYILRQEIREFQFSNQVLNNDLKDLKNIRNNPLIASDKNCMSIKAKEHWFYIHVLISYLKWDFNSGLKMSSQYVDFMNQNLHLFDHNKTLPALSNYIFHAALTTDKNHFELGKKRLLTLSSIKGTPVLYIKYIPGIRILYHIYVYYIIYMQLASCCITSGNSHRFVRLTDDDLYHSDPVCAVMRMLCESCVVQIPPVRKHVRKKP